MAHDGVRVRARQDTHSCARSEKDQRWRCPLCDFEAQFDQAGILVREDEIHWLKAGMEISEEVAEVGAVVTRGMSDWSLAPVPEWHGGIVTVRVSWTGDALTVRARSGASAWRLVRVSPWMPSSSTVMAGAYLAAPTSADFAYGSPNGRLARRMPSCTPSSSVNTHGRMSQGRRRARTDPASFNRTSGSGNCR